MSDKIQGRAPFAMVPEWLLFSGASDRAIVLFAVLAKHADHQAKAYPGRARLAKMMNRSVKTIDRAKEELIEVGALVVEERHDEQGKQTSNLYTLNFLGATDVSPLGVTDDTVGATDVSPELDPDELEDHSEASPPRGREQVVSTRKRNLPFDALASLVPGYVAKTDGPRIARYLKEIRERLAWEVVNPEPRGDESRVAWILAFDVDDPLANEALANEIYARAEMYRRKWPDIELTPKALAEHFTRIHRGGDKGGRLTAADVLAQVDPSALGRAS